MNQNQKQTGGYLLSQSKSPSRSRSRTKRTDKDSSKSNDKGKLQNQSQSQSQSKNGGRRRKSTMRKLRRMKKSRKVMRGGGKYTNEQLAAAYKNYININKKDTIYQLRQWVFPELFQLTTVGMKTDKERDGVPLFWKYPDALEKALTEDPALNKKINSNLDLIKTLNPKTPEEAAAAEAEKLGYTTNAKQEKSVEEDTATRMGNNYVI